MKWLTALLLTISLSMPALIRAGGRKLVMGTFYRTVKNLLEVKDDSGKIVVVRFDASTTCVNSSTEKSAKLKDISAGDQVVIKVISKDGVDTAEQVKFVPALVNR